MGEYRCHTFRGWMQVLSLIWYRYSRSNPGRILGKENLLGSFVPGSGRFEDVIHIAGTAGMEIYSDVVTQKVLCR